MDDIFDYVDKTAAENPQDIFDVSLSLPKPIDDSFFNSVKDYGKTLLKGSAEGIGKLGRMVGPTVTDPLQSSISLDQQTENLDKLLPTDEGFIQKSLRRGLREAPSVLSFPGSSLQTGARLGGAALLGQSTEELGAPEWAQTAAELSAFIGPDIFKKLVESGNKKQIIEAARKLGMSDEAITPLIQSDFKQKYLSWAVPRRGKTTSILKNTKNELSNVYQNIQKSEIAKQPVNSSIRKQVISSIEEKLKDLPNEVRDKIIRDFAELKNGKMTGESLINFYADVNEVAGKYKKIFTIKDPIKKSLKSIDPSLEKDFSLINDLYSKYYKISGKLKPNLTTDILGASEAIGTLSALMTGYYPVLLKIAGEKTGRKIAQNMLLNPRFQQIPEKIIRAVKDNKFQIARKGIEELQQLVKKDSPEIAEKLSDISDEELLSIFQD